MPRVRDLLYRFRPAGVPGAATPAGVPTDRAADLAAELAPVLAALEPTERQCTALVDHARREAADQLDRSDAEAREIVADARARAPAERAATIARLRAGQEEVNRGGLAAADETARDVRRLAARRAPDYVDRVVDSVRALLDERLPADPSGASARTPTTFPTADDGDRGTS